MTLVGRTRRRSPMEANAFPLTVSGGSAFAQWDVGYLHTDGTVRRSQRDGADAEAEVEVICIAPAGVADGASGLFSGPGLISGYGGTPGETRWLGATPGATASTPPAGGSGQWATRCGMVVDSGDLLFQPRAPIGM